MEWYFLRGISVCDRWSSFDNFLADMGEKPVGTSIDRIDNNKGYSPDNCRWATPKQQARNTRRNKLITIEGQQKTLAEWVEFLGVNKATYYTRRRSGKSEREALGFRS